MIREEEEEEEPRRRRGMVLAWEGIGVREVLKKRVLVLVVVTRQTGRLLLIPPHHTCQSGHNLNTTSLNVSSQGSMFLAYL